MIKLTGSKLKYSSIPMEDKLHTRPKGIAGKCDSCERMFQESLIGILINECQRCAAWSCGLCQVTRKCCGTFLISDEEKN